MIGLSTYNHCIVEHLAGNIKFDSLKKKNFMKGFSEKNKASLIMYLECINLIGSWKTIGVLSDNL